MRESLEQTPRRIHTGKGGKRTEMTTRRMSDKHSQHMGGGLAGGIRSGSGEAEDV